MKEYRYFSDQSSILTKNRRKPKAYEITGAKIETDAEGNISQKGFDQAVTLMQLYCDNEYESARYLFVTKEGDIICHLAFSNGIPNSTLPYPDEKEINEIRNYALENDCQIIFFHNHPNGFVNPSPADISLTEKLSEILIDNSMKKRLAAHIILDTGSDTYGFWNKDSHDWNIHYKGMFHSINEYNSDVESRRLIINHNLEPDRKLIYLPVGDEKTPQYLSQIERVYNSDGAWDKDWIPAFFLKEYGIVEHIEYIHKSLLNDYKAFDSKLQDIGTKTGSTRCYLLPYDYEIAVECMKYAEKNLSYKGKVYENGTIEAVYCSDENIPSQLRCRVYGRSVFDNLGSRTVKIRDDSRNYPLGYSMKNIDISETESSKEINNMSEIKSVLPEEIVKYVNENSLWAITEAQAKQYIESFKRAGLEITVDLENKRLGVSGNTAGTIFEDLGEKNLDIPDIQLFIEKEDERTRTDIALQIRENMPNLSDEERASALSILETGAKSMGLSISEYVAQTFPEGIFGNIAEAQKAAWKQGKEMNGAVVVDGFGENARAVIYASRTADFSTWVHEIAHIWQAQLTGNLKRRAEEAFQVQDGDWKKSIYTFADGHTDSSGEAFAYGFEDCLKNAESEFSAPDKKRIYEKFAQYMSRTYNGLGKNIEISDEIRKVYDAFLLVDDNILAKAEKAVRMEKEFSANRLNTIEHRHAKESAFQYQIVGENSIRAMSKSLERNRILSNLTAAVALDESITNVTGEAKAARIRIETGWEKDASGQWKYETDDSISHIKKGSSFEKILNTNPKALTYLTADGKTMKLSDLLDAQELFSIFPFMKEVKVRFYDEPDTYRALLDSDGIMINTHYLNTTNGEKGLKGVLAHEIQHIIQAIEYTGKNDLKGENLEELYLETMKAMREVNTGIYDYDTNCVDAGIEKYMREAGEIEARNVARRIAFSDSERRHKTLRSTEEMMNKMQFQSIELKQQKTRSSYLEGKTELTDEDIINILDLPKEKYDKNLIDYYTSKEYKELRDLPQELSTLINTLKESPVYLKYHNTYISKTKLLFEDSGKLYNEIPCLIILNEINKKAYLLPYEFSKDDNNNIRTFADSLKEDIFTDFKRVFSSNIHNAVERGLNQGQDLFILVNNNSIDRESIKERLTDYERKRKHKEGLYLFYSEKDYCCYSFKYDDKGFLVEDKDYDLKKLRLAISDEPVSLNPKESSSPQSSDLNIHDDKLFVNELFFSLLHRGEIDFYKNTASEKDFPDKDKSYLKSLNILKSKEEIFKSNIIKDSNSNYLNNEFSSKYYNLIKNIQFQEIKHKESIMNAFDYQNKLSEDERNILKLNLIGNSYARHTDLERFGHPNEIGKGKDMLINFTTCDGKNMELKTKDDVTSYVIEMQSEINSMKNYISKDELKDLKKVLKEINTHLKQFPNNEEASHKLSSRLSSLENKVRFYQENHRAPDGKFDANKINYPDGYEKTIEVFNAAIEHRTEIIRDADLSDAIKKALGINNEHDISLFDAAFGKERLRQREYNEDISADKIVEAFYAAKLGIPARYEISKMGIPDDKYNNIYSRINSIAHLSTMNPGDSNFNKNDSIYKFKDYKMVIAKQVTDSSIHNIEINSISAGLDFVSELLSDDIKKDMWKDAEIEPPSIENEVEQEQQIQFQELTNEKETQTDVHELKGDNLKKDFMSVLAADFYLKPEEQSFAEMFSEKLMSRYSPAQLGEINSIVLNMTGANSKSEVFSSLEKQVLELQKNTEQAVSEDLSTKDLKGLSEKYMNSSPVEKEAFKKVFDETIQVKLGNDLSKESPDTTELSKIVQTRFITADISDRILNGKALEGRDGEKLVSLNSIDDVIKYIQSDPQRFERSEWVYGKDTEKFKQADREKSIEKQKTNYVLEKLSAAGIDVVTDKEEFKRILESQIVLQKMSADLSEIEKLSKQLNEEKSKTEKLEKTVEQHKSDIQHQNYEDFIKYLDSVKDYIPEEINFSEKMNIMGASYYHKLTNKIPISFDSSDADNWIVKPDNNNKLYIVSSHYTGLRDIYNYEDVKEYFTDNSILTTFQESLTSFFAKNISLEKEKQKNFISDLDKQTEELKILEKKEARKNVKEWATKENYDLAFLNSSSKITELFGSERKAIGVLPLEINQIFPTITDYNLYAQKDYFIDHWVNHHSELTESIFDELQNVLDNYDDIYRDPDNGTVVFVKQEGRLNDFLVVEQKDDKLVFYDSTFLRKGIPSRFEKITPVREQELKNTVEVRHTSSTARQGLSDPAAGISTLNGNSNISQKTTKSSPQTMVQNGNTYGFAYEGKIYLNPEVMNSEVAVHEYIHLWDNYTQRTNPELWEKGKSIFKNTKFWEEVKSDPNYADIADNDDLLLSEVHSRICGKMADKVLSKIAEQNGELTKDTVINWDKETWEYVCEELIANKSFNLENGLSSKDLSDFLAMPVKDLMQERNISVERSEGLSQDNHNPENVASISDVEQNLSDSKNTISDTTVNISDIEQNISDDNDTSIAEKEVNSDELKFTKTPIDKSQVTTEIPTVNLNPESIVSEPQKENHAGNNINSKEFLLGALKCNSPEEYEEYYKNNYHFNGKAAFKPCLPIADNKMVLYINGKETKKVFDNTKEQLASMTRWCVEQGFDFLIPTPEDVKKYGRDAIVKNAEIFNKLLGTDITQEQSNSLISDAKQQTDVNKGQGNSTPMLYANGTLTEQEMELFQHLEIDKISEFIKDPYQHDVAVPKFGYEKVNPQTGKTELIEQTGWHFAQKEIQAGTVSAIILTKMNENGQREFLKLDPTTYEAMVNRGSELMKTWNQPLSKEAHLASVYSYEDSLKIERSSRRSNTCCNYLHNFMAMCRGEDGGTPANNIKEAMAVAAKIYYQMSPHEKERLKKMEKEWNESHDNTFQEELERRFKEIIKERVYSHDDLAYAGHDNKGYVNKAGLEANSGNKLLEEKTGKKIGDSVKLSINFKNTKGDVFQLDTAEYKIAGASREQNCICVINSQTNEKWEMPLDKFIERQQQINKKQEKIQQHHVKTEKKIETKQKQKENDIYSMGL